MGHCFNSTLNYHKVGALYFDGSGCLRVSGTLCGHQWTVLAGLSRSGAPLGETTAWRRSWLSSWGVCIGYLVTQSSRVRLKVPTFDLRLMLSAALRMGCLCSSALWRGASPELWRPKTKPIHRHFCLYTLLHMTRYMTRYMTLYIYIYIHIYIYISIHIYLFMYIYI